MKIRQESRVSQRLGSGGAVDNSRQREGGTRLLRTGKDATLISFRRLNLMLL